MSGERLAKGLHVLREDRETGRRPVSAVAPRCPAHAEAPCRSNAPTERPEPTHVPPSVPAMSTTGRLNRSTSREATMPITPRCQSSPGQDIRAAAAVSLGPLLDLLDGIAEDALLHGLAVTVELLELGGEPFRLAPNRR